MPLSDVKIRNAKPAEKLYKLYDSQCLYLYIGVTGKKHWNMKYTFMGKDKSVSLEQYTTLGLAEARQLRDKIKLGLVNGIDPQEQRKANRMRGFVATENSFEAVARRWHEVRRGTEVHKVRCWRRLEIYVLPKLGLGPVQDITTMDNLTLALAVGWTCEGEAFNLIFFGDGVNIIPVKNV